MTAEDLRLTLRLTTKDFDLELLAIAQAGMADLRMAGITGTDSLADLDDITAQAVKTYVRMNFGKVPPDEFDRLERSYNTQKGQLMKATGHTDWGDLA